MNGGSWTVQKQDDSCTHCTDWGLNLLYQVSENTRAAGAYSKAGHRWAEPNTEFSAAVSSLAGVPCSNRGTWRFQRWVVRMLLGRWANSILEAWNYAF